MSSASGFTAGDISSYLDQKEYKKALRFTGMSMNDEGAPRARPRVYPPKRMTLWAVTNRGHWAKQSESSWAAQYLWQETKRAVEELEKERIQYERRLGRGSNEEQADTKKRHESAVSRLKTARDKLEKLEVLRKTA
jgi:hypothetical protein